MRKISSILWGALLATSTFAQTGSDIDARLEECMNEDPSTAGMVQCLQEAFNRWDEELNSVYKKLLNKLDPETKSLLKETELNWIKFKDSELKFIDKIYSMKEGTMYVPLNLENKVQIIRKRTLELKGYLDLLEIY